MTEPKITGAMRIMDGSTKLRTLKEINALLDKLLPTKLFEHTRWNRIKLWCYW